jgi:hypothetical protein
MLQSYHRALSDHGKDKENIRRKDRLRLPRLRVRAMGHSPLCRLFLHPVRHLEAVASHSHRSILPTQKIICGARKPHVLNKQLFLTIFFLIYI